MRGFRRTGVQDRWFHIGFITHDFTLSPERACRLHAHTVGRGVAVAVESLSLRDTLTTRE